jgi:hypothetical protein
MKDVWRSLAMLLIGGVLGTGLGVAVGLLVAPLVFAPPPRTDPVQVDDLGSLLATGSFIQPDKNDPLRRGAGGVSVHQKAVLLDSDFLVPPGPGYRVLLVPKPAIRTAADIANTMYVDLGPLPAFKGDVRFDIPAGVDLAQYPSVVIWCSTYASLISTADLNFAGPSS